MAGYSDIDKAAAGDHVAFRRIVAAHQGPVFGFLGRMGLDRASCEDIAQDTFIRVWRHASHFDGRRARLGTWILTIARNLALNHLATAARRREVGGVDVAGVGHDLPGPGETGDTDPQADRLDRALERLSPADRSLLAASYVEGLSLAEIARIEGCTVGAAKVRLHRARGRLRDILEKADG